MTMVRTGIEAKKYKPYTLNNFKQIPQIQNLPEELVFNMEVVGNVLPFRANNYVVEELIDWNNIPNDPIFVLTFPTKGMLSEAHFNRMAELIRSNAPKDEIKRVANEIRLDLNPHPAGQLEHNVPTLNDEKVVGTQHKYNETVLFFPTQGQTCHAYCTFCFRWAQFVGMDDLKFATKEAETLLKYLKEHKEVTDVLFTGGDPMVMRTKNIRAYFEVLLKAKENGEIPHVSTIRIGTKALSYWPYRFVTDPDADDLLNLFKEANECGIHISVMAHFNHLNELKTDVVERAIQAIRSTGAQLRTQSPLLTHINDDADMWAAMWKKQVSLGLIPYYMFVVRDTGAQDYFGISLERAWEIFHNAYIQIPGIARTVRGPSMSAGPGKVQVLGVSEVAGEKVFVLQFLQGRNHDWATRPFFAKYKPDAIWLDDLEPAFGEKEFFFEAEYKEKYS